MAAKRTEEFRKASNLSSTVLTFSQLGITQAAMEDRPKGLLAGCSAVLAAKRSEKEGGGDSKR